MPVWKRGFFSAVQREVFSYLSAQRHMRAASFPDVEQISIAFEILFWMAPVTTGACFHG